MATTTTTTETTKITKTENCTETMFTAAFTTVNTDGAPVTRYSIGTNYTYGTHTYSIVGVRKYTGDAHSYWLVKFDSDPTTHEMTADKIKDYVGDDRKQIRNGSANDDKKATGTKRVPKTANETAAQIRTKYADTIKNVRDKVSKLQDDDRILGALNLLCTMIDSVATERIENVTNAARNAYLANIARRENATAELNQKQTEMQAALSKCDFAEVAVLGNAAKELQAELILLEQKIAAYETEQVASEASEATEAATAEETAEETAE